ncbi:MAG TPA: cytochrome c3 family protein [Edaphobacter sp.]
MRYTSWEIRVQKLLLKSFYLVAILFAVAAGLHAQDAPAKPAPVQPIPFNHKLHAADGKTTCDSCHIPRGDGSTLALPQAASCMKCHNTVATDNPDVKRLAEMAKNEDPIPWVRVYRVPSFVSFSHKTHTDAGSKCEDCHGPVAERTAISQEKETTMAACIGCHTAKGAKATCDTCHAIMSQNGPRPGYNHTNPFDADQRLLARLNAPAQSAPPSHHASAAMALASVLHAPLL